MSNLKSAVTATQEMAKAGAKKAAAPGIFLWGLIFAFLAVCGVINMYSGIGPVLLVFALVALLIAVIRWFSQRGTVKTDGASYKNGWTPE